VTGRANPVEVALDTGVAAAVTLAPCAPADPTSILPAAPTTVEVSLGKEPPGPGHRYAHTQHCICVIVRLVP